MSNNNLQKAVSVCKGLVKKLGLKMNITGADYDPKERKILFTYEADGRVDFRELLQLLHNELNLKIELKQIGPRDLAKSVGGIGPCGQECCCKRFMRKFEPVTIKMLKDQGLQGSPQKYSGYCGKLLCCIAFEHCGKNGNAKCDECKREK